MNSADEVLLVVGVGIWLILQIVSWVRVSRVRSELSALQSRLAALEAAEASRLSARLRHAAAPAQTSDRVGMTPQPAAPPIVLPPPAREKAG